MFMVREFGLIQGETTPHYISRTGDFIGKTDPDFQTNKSSTIE